MQQATETTKAGNTRSQGLFRGENAPGRMLASLRTLVNDPIKSVIFIEDIAALTNSLALNAAI